MMEFYEAYADYKSLMDFTEGLIRQAAREALGTETFDYQGRTLDLSKPFRRMTTVEAIHYHHPGYSLTNLNDAGWLRQKLADLKVEVVSTAGLGTLQMQLFEETTEAELWEPTFIIDYPTEVSPLARRSDSNPDVTERFELFIVGREIANGFSELNDPEDQAARFLEQAKAKEAGDEEAMYYDADYIRALEYGLPPTGGCGIGIDRLVMLLTDSPGDPRRDPLPADAAGVNYAPIVPAELALRGNGRPTRRATTTSTTPPQGGLEQARHVFLGGNDLPRRWAGRERFVILETGFGLGLNFLATWQAWRNDPQRCRRLHFVSIEKHPFRRDDLARLHEQWPELAELSAQLVDAWPTLVPGLHRLHFENEAVTLTLVFGDAVEWLPQLTLAADAFYLDGFSPDRNPELWSDAIVRATAPPGRAGRHARHLVGRRGRDEPYRHG